MKKKRSTEQELLKDLNPRGAHANELDPLDRLKGSVKKLERPTDPATDPEDWGAWFDGEGVSGDLMEGKGEKR